MQINTVFARGLLRHCFWGAYQAQIILRFRDAIAARDALRVLGAPWRIGDTSPEVLACMVDSAALEHVKDKLESFGADRKKIDSVATSIDFGEPFLVQIPVVPEEQVALFKEVN